MGKGHGDGGGHPPYPREQGNLRPEEGDHRADFRDGERTARVPLYTVYREGADGDESRAYLCVHGPKETGKDPCKKRGGGLPSKERPHMLKKIYLKIKEKCWNLTLTPLFIYSLHH